MKIFAFACALVATQSFADSLTFTTEESPPFNMTVSGSVRGLATEAVMEMASRAGQTIKIAMLPWERAYDMARKEPDTCVYSTTRTPPREALFKWVGPLAVNKWVLYARADAKPVAKIDDVKAAKIGGYRGDAISNFLKDGGYKVEDTTNDAQNPEKLAAGRIDYWATSEAVGGTLVKQKKITGIKVILTFKEAGMYLACGKGVADGTIEQLNDALASMSKDDTLEQIRKKYL